MDNRNLQKILRKVKRCEEILLRYENILTCKEPTNALFIGNGGLDCGIEEQLLQYEFSSYGEIENIVMLPGRPYAFVVFKEVANAEKAMTHANGQELKVGHVFYMSYVKNTDVPDGRPKKHNWPSGLVLLEDFLTKYEEHWLMTEFNVKNISDDKAVLKRRKVQHFGYEFVYGSNNIDKSKALEQKIPGACILFLERLVALGHIPRIPEQLTVNHYLPGQGIPPHVDTHSAFEDGIVSISLGSDVVMDFYCPGQDSVPVILPRRSALIMTGESRYRWRHGITQRKTDIVPTPDGNRRTISHRNTRTSLTFRLIRDGDCKCEYPEQCDSQSKPKSSIVDLVNDEAAEELEKMFVSKVYDNIANHFSMTRYKPWPKVEAFLASIPKGAFVLDVGCGNGKNLNLTSGCFEVGCDASPALSRLSSERGAQVVMANCLTLPFRDNCADVVMCIAVIHHMSTRSRRIEAIREIVRVLRPGGCALLYVWAFEQDNAIEGPSNYLKGHKGAPLQPIKEEQFSEINLKHFKGHLPLHMNRTSFQEQDLLVPWKENGTNLVHHRFYHVFARGELEFLVFEAGGETVSSYYDKGNWCAVMQKRR